MTTRRSSLSRRGWESSVGEHRQAGAGHEEHCRRRAAVPRQRTGRSRRRSSNGRAARSPSPAAETNPVSPPAPPAGRPRHRRLRPGACPGSRASAGHIRPPRRLRPAAAGGRHDGLRGGHERVEVRAWMRAGRRAPAAANRPCRRRAAPSLRLEPTGSGQLRHGGEGGDPLGARRGADERGHAVAVTAASSYRWAAASRSMRASRRRTRSCGSAVKATRTASRAGRMRRPSRCPRTVPRIVPSRPGRRGSQASRREPLGALPDRDRLVDGGHRRLGQPAGPERAEIRGVVGPDLTDQGEPWEGLDGELSQVARSGNRDRRL